MKRFKFCRNRKSLLKILAKIVKKKKKKRRGSIQVRLLSLGATVHSVIYPGEGAEEARDVVLGFDKVSIFHFIFSSI